MVQTATGGSLVFLAVTSGLILTFKTLPKTVHHAWVSVFHTPCASAVSGLPGGRWYGIASVWPRSEGMGKVLTCAGRDGSFGRGNGIKARVGSAEHLPSPHLHVLFPPCVPIHAWALSAPGGWSVLKNRDALSLS